MLFDKPWMRPMQYTDDNNAGAPESRDGAETESRPWPEDLDEHLLRMESNRMAKVDAKPTGPWVDNTPLRYRDGNPDQEFGLDDQDELE
jgi:hypothetical protein